MISNSLFFFEECDMISNMKKKKSFLAILLCVCMLLFAGCMDGGPGGLGGDDDDGSFGEVLSMEGVKVLSKPTDYKFDDAVGDNSVNYYNEFAREILRALYNVYENPNAINALDKTQEEVFFDSLDENNGQTFNHFTDDDNKYYLYDSLRYTLKSVQNSNENDFKVKITLDASKPWEWTIPYNNSKHKIIFMTVELADNEPNFPKLDDMNFEFSDFDSSWTDIYNNEYTTTPAFPEFYYQGENAKNEGQTAYFTSPYYQSVYGKQEDEADAKNFFQDALEYATYLFVLGYDYVDENGQATEDAPYFDFEVVTDATTGEVTDVKVGGWLPNNQKISVSYKQEDGGESALGRVKALYEKIGGYVGLTGEKYGPGNNIEQVERFIKDKVIGQDAWGTGENAGGKFRVNVSTDIDASGHLDFNRNYEKIVHNVVKYACTKAPIGGTGDSKLELDEPYLASVITDYKGNYFEPYTSGDNIDNYDDEDKFHFIEAAEYQSIIFMPNKDEFDPNDPMFLSDIMLYFEYWDDTSKTFAETQPDAKRKKHAETITINVGFRYFDHEANAYTANNEVQKTIEFGKFPVYDDYGFEEYGKAFDSHTVMFSDTDTAGCIPFDKNNIGKELQIKTTFTSPTAIDAFASGTEIEGVNPDDAKRIVIGGGNEAKDYYSLNKSSSYGFYGTLNSEMFVGDNGCDFIEVYFDVVKPKGAHAADVDYSFKVCAEFVTMRESEKI